jgi:U3 small nucleolar RNA-associated protein 24
MGRAKKTRKFAEVKRMLNPNDSRLKANQEVAAKKEKEKAEKEAPRQVDQPNSSLYFKYNKALGPPYHVIVDTNFINFSIQNRIELMKGMMDCLLAKCVPVILDSVMAELELLGPKYVSASYMYTCCRILRRSCHRNLL